MKTEQQQKNLRITLVVLVGIALFFFFGFIALKWVQ